MSRSRKKSKVQSVSNADTEKEDKRFANRKHRRIVKQQVKSGKENLAQLKEVSNVWSFDKDGKHYDPDSDPSKLRK